MSNNIKLHDFEKSKKYNLSQIKFLTTCSESFAKSSTLQLQYELKNKSNMKMVLKEVYQEPCSDFLEKMDYDTVIVDFNIGENANNLIFNIEKKVSLVMIDCLLGSSGTAVVDKELTDIDIEIINYITNVLFKKAESAIDVKNVNINDIYTNKALYRNTNSKGYTFVSIVEVYLNNEIIGNIKISLPYVSLEKSIELIMSKKNSKDLPKHYDNNINNEVLETLFENRVQLDVVAELGSIDLSVEELLGLEPGDAFTLNTKINEDIKILVGGRASYVGKPGKVGTNNAVIITNSIEGEDIDHDERENE